MEKLFSKESFFKVAPYKQQLGYAGVCDGPLSPEEERKASIALFGMFVALPLLLLSLISLAEDDQTKLHQHAVKVCTSHPCKFTYEGQSYKTLISTSNGIKYDGESYWAFKVRD